MARCLDIRQYRTGHYLDKAVIFTSHYLDKDSATREATGLMTTVVPIHSAKPAAGIAPQRVGVALSSGQQHFESEVAAQCRIMG